MKESNLILTVTCKCGSTYAATLLLGDVEIGNEFIDDAQKTLDDGGKLEIIDRRKSSVNWEKCKCKTT